MRILPFEYAVRNLGRSPARLLATVLGSALVVFLVIAAAAFVNGMTRALGSPDNNRNVILLGTGSEESIERSQIGAAVATHAAAGIDGIREQLGVAFVSPEVHMALLVAREERRDEELRATLRGVTPAAFLVHQQVRIIEGRSPRAGHDEIIVGSLASQMLNIPDADLAIGKSIWFDERAWNIVGRFAAPGSVIDAEIWMPLSDLQIAARRETLSCIVLTMGEGEFADVDAWAKMRLDLELSAITETEYYASIRRFYRPIQAMVWGTAVLMGLAGLLGGLNTLYSAFSSRTREVGMLQSLGFPRRAILLSIVQESLLASCAGALVSCALAWLLIDGAAVRFSMGVFQLAVNSPAIAAGLAAGILVGSIGAIPPAFQCLRLPIPSALKST